ncbi:MAG: RNA ligase family protein [Christensenellales bacterium]|jgi:hypothetical protein|nr:RNA ligase family protein [Clostridiales bacterium]
MIKKILYPKTQRLPARTKEYAVITEKLDGSNLCIFKLNDELYIAQRNNIINVGKEFDDISYSGLKDWLTNYKDFLLENLHNNSVICGEWLGMGKIKYTVDKFDKRFYMFAKANINEDYELYNMIYEEEYFKYPFVNEVIPYFIGIRPEVTKTVVIPDKEFLDKLYDKYTRQEKRKVEGFIIIIRNTIQKYVRMKNGKITEHFDYGE